MTHIDDENRQKCIGGFMNSKQIPIRSRLKKNKERKKKIERKKERKKDNKQTNKGVQDTQKGFLSIPTF